MTSPQARYAQRILRVLVAEGGDADGVLASASVVGVGFFAASVAFVAHDQLGSLLLPLRG